MSTVDWVGAAELGTVSFGTGMETSGGIAVLEPETPESWTIVAGDEDGDDDDFADEDSDEFEDDEFEEESFDEFADDDEFEEGDDSDDDDDDDDL